MAVATITLSPATIKRLNELGSQILGLIKTGTSVRIWKGQKDVVNPTTQEKTGAVRETVNLDVAVPQDLYESAHKGIEASKNSGHYIEVEMSGVKLVAIAARRDELNNRFIVQFAKPNTGSTFDSTSQDFKSKFMEEFGKNTQPAASVPNDDEVPF
jgi:hypothetical protein